MEVIRFGRQTVWTAAYDGAFNIYLYFSLSGSTVENNVLQQEVDRLGLVD
jgi:hypothetical protein